MRREGGEMDSADKRERKSNRKTERGRQRSRDEKGKRRAGMDG